MARIAFLGGTGPQGVGLALRFAIAGEEVIIGSRRRERAERAVRRVRERMGTPAPERHLRAAADNARAAQQADIVALTVPFHALEPLLSDIGPALAGKLILDVVNPLELIDGLFRLIPVSAGSAAGLIQALLPRAKVVSGFKNISAVALGHADRELHGDVLLCGDMQGKHWLSGIVERMPRLRAVDAGPLVNAFYLESITALLLNLNRQHQAITSVQILGL